MVLDIDSRSAHAERSQPLIAPVPLDAVFAAAAEWQSVDQRLTASQGALDGAIAKMRQALSSASITVDETPGADVASVDDAIAALDRSRQALTTALNARAKALTALDQARGASDAPLRQAEDILLARRAVAVCVALLLGLIALILLT
jgi:hypothetical protein